MALDFAPFGTGSEWPDSSFGVRTASGIPRDAAFEQAFKKRCRPLIVTALQKFRPPSTERRSYRPRRIPAHTL